MSEVSPSFLIITFCARTAGFVARWHDFFANLSLRRMVKSCGCCRKRPRGSEATNTGGGASIQTSCAKLATTYFTGELASGNRASRVPRATVALRREEAPPCVLFMSSCVLFSHRRVRRRARSVSYAANPRKSSSSSEEDTTGNV